MNLERYCLRCKKEVLKPDGNTMYAGKEWCECDKIKELLSSDVLKIPCSHCVKGLCGAIPITVLREKCGACVKLNVRISFVRRKLLIAEDQIRTNEVARKFLCEALSELEMLKKGSGG